MEKALVIMAAGLGSRYGGDKQIDGVGPGNEILMEYGIFDALAAGFNKLVFIIKPDIKKLVADICGDRLSKIVEVEYAEQTFDSVAPLYDIPPTRVKPFGTVHALLCAREYINAPFAILNADDYYGREAFFGMSKALDDIAPAGEAIMMGYRLKNTVSDYGTVTRGVCDVENGRLMSVTETYKIAPAEGGIRDFADSEEGVPLDPDALVSMNFWGFAPTIFDVAERYFKAFLASIKPNDIKAECLLPVMANDLMHAGELVIRAVPTESKWFGITYREDKPRVMEALKKLHEAGEYPATLK